MAKKDKFIEEVYALVQDNPESFFSKDALDFWNGLIGGKNPDKPAFTKNGLAILKYMQDNKDIYNNLFKAKEVGEGMGISSRTVSGSLRKLVADGWVEKVGIDPIVYAITEKGEKVDLSNADLTS